MTGGIGFSYEFSKYAIIAFMAIGMFYKGFNLKSWPYILFLFLLMPGVLISAILVDFNTKFGNVIGFNLSGPVCLGMTALYCFKREISQERFNTILVCCLLPIIATTAYLYLYTPDIREALSGTQSNFEASGGFGPNQVATVLGLGMFILFSRLFLIKNRLINGIDLAILGFMSYRAIITFSRGGVLTALICAVLFLFFYFRNANKIERASLITKTGVVALVITFTWIITSVFTSGLIDKRYNNQDAAGRVKQDITTGRGELIESELQAFKTNPIFGIGAGRTKEFRREYTGVESATHNEVSRMLSEHGILGIIALIILLFTPLTHWLGNKNNIFIFSFLSFWFLTINHSSMRIAAPAFIYGLCLITIVHEKKHRLHR